MGVGMGEAERNSISDSFSDEHETEEEQTVVEIIDFPTGEVLRKLRLILSESPGMESVG